MVRLKEFHDEPTLEYNLLDDIHFFIMNDDDFYRKQYYPVMNKCKQSGNNDDLIPVIDSAIKEYCGKYKVAGHFIKQITDQDKHTIIQRLVSGENQNGE